MMTQSHQQRCSDPLIEKLSEDRAVPMSWALFALPRVVQIEG